jgi:hypothetical protein
MDDTFTPRYGNDAYGAIRGFVYQVDLTIERWLDLRADERLELERGEDIDHLSRALLRDETRNEGDTSELRRIMEQVKHLQRPITLRSSSVRAALCNAFEHFRANPGQRLLFRFTTTAVAAREASSPLPGGISGIQAWEELRLASAAAAGMPAYQKDIRLLLRARKPPKGVQTVAWRRFQKFLRDAEGEAFVAFVRRFEWSVAVPGIEVRSANITRKLIENGRASSPEEAQGLYDRLFVYVFRLLSKNGLKSLSPKELDHTLAQPTLAAGDRQLLLTLAEALGGIEERVGSVERTLAEYSAALPGISDRLDNLARQQGIEAAVDYTVATPDLDPPPPLAVGASRGATVDRLWQVVQQHTWTALIGASTTGKTQLALSVVRTHAVTARWLRLRDLSVAQASMRLDKAVESLGGVRAGRSLREWYEAIALGLSTSHLLVIDDVPRFQTGDELAVRLDALLQACAHAGMYLLTTSAYPIPPSYHEQYSEQQVVTMEVPPFTEGETR